jgi:hypothetical protein
MATVLQTWLSCPKVVSLDALGSTCSVLQAVVERIQLASKPLAQPNQLTGLLSPLLHGSVHVWLDAMTNMLRVAPVALVYLPLAQAIARSVSTILRVCFDVHQRLSLPLDILARLKDINSHLLLSNFCAVAQAICAFAATQDDPSLSISPEPFVQLQLHALMLYVQELYQDRLELSLLVQGLYLR